MDSSLVLGLRFDFAASAFGTSAASFLSHLDHSHPDLLLEPFSSFHSELVEISRCLSFCEDNGLKAPLSRLLSSSPRGHDLFFSALRLLGPLGRAERRSQKSPFWFDAGSLARDVASSSPDLPSSFERFKGSDRRDKCWSSMEADFISAGCGLMATAARSSADEFVRDEMGLVRLGSKRALMIVAKRMDASCRGGDLHPVAIPAHMAPLPDWARSSINASEAARMGRPMFDHHVVVTLLRQASIPESLDSDIVVLGERDGRLYFVDSD